MMMHVYCQKIEYATFKGWSYTYLASSASTRLEEALFEIFREESVKDGIHSRVGVAQASTEQEEEKHHSRMTWWFFLGCKYQSQLYSQWEEKNESNGLNGFNIS